MAQKTKAQIQAQSDTTYIDNTAGQITPAAVRSLNTDWIDSVLFVDQTGSVLITSASYATTASFLIGSIESSSYAGYAAQAGNANTFQNLVPSSFVGTASFSQYSQSVAQRNNTDEVNFNNTSASLSIRVTNLESFSSSLDTTFATDASVTASILVLSSSVQASQVALSSSLSSRMTSQEAFSSSLGQAFASPAQVTASINAFSSSIAPDIASKLPTTTFTPFSSSISGRVNIIETSYATTGSNTFTGNNVFGNITASNAQFASASITNLTVIYQTSSIVFSSGSNVFGDNANDVQTLWGRVNLVTGPLSVTGSTSLQQLTASGIAYPSSDGDTNQYITTQGNGVAYFDYVKTIIETVKNDSGVQLIKGTPVHVTGVTGATPLVVAASASNAATMPATYILGETLADQQEGQGIILGLISGVNTAAFSAGDVVYVGANGGYTNVQPTGTNLIQPLGLVTKVDATTGQGLVLNPGVTNGLPNLAQGNVWLGNSSGVPAAVTGSSLYVQNSVSASNALTASKVTLVSNSDNFDYFIPFSLSGVQELLLDGGSNLLYNPSTNTLTVPTVLGNLNGTASLANVANTANSATSSISASYAIDANNAYAATSSLTSISSSYAATASLLLGSVTSASFATTANSVNALSQSLVITGSFNGLVVSQSIASSTSSFNFGTANFFTSLVTGSTFFNITNPKPGETVNVLLTTQGAGQATASFSSNVKQVSGSSYLPTAGSNKKDILTFISFDGTDVYLANIKNLV